MPGLLLRVERFLDQEIDDSDRREPEALLARARREEAEARRELEERFSGPLRFGTAG